MLATLLAVAMTQATSASPKATLGRDLYHDCAVTVGEIDSPQRHGDNNVPVLSCLEYVQGFRDALRMMNLGCFTPQSNTVTLVRLYVNYMKEHPKLMDEEPGEGLLLVVADSYPCSKKP